MNIDFKELSENLKAITYTLCEQWLPDGQKNGKNWVATCPWRPDAQKGSFLVNLNDGYFKDFASNDKGDMIELYAKIKGIKNIEAAKELSDQYQGQKFESMKAREPVKVVEDFQLLKPEREATQDELKNPARLHTYRDSAGELLGYVCRYEFPDGRKMTIPKGFYLNKSTGTKGWESKKFGSPGPLYNLDLIAANPDKVILLVEGEKCADAVNNSDLGKKLTGVAWPGGTNGLKNIDLSPLKGRNVIFWPDRDEPGLKCALELISYLKEKTNLRLLMPKKSWEKGADVADFVGKVSINKIFEFIKNNLTIEDAELVYSQTLYPEKFKNSEDEPKENLPPLAVYSEEEYYQAAPLEVIETVENEPFRILGINNGTYYYFSEYEGNVVGLKANDHKKTNLFRLGTMQYWSKKFPSKSGIDWDSVINYLMMRCSKKDYDLNDLRGPGAWFDEGRTVINLGRTLIVDNQEMNINDFKDTEYIYLRQKRTKFSFSTKIENEQSNKFYQICSELNWDSNLQAQLFAGWAVLAPICGALTQRPHAWLTAKSGSGKTYILDYILNPVLGGEVEYVAGGTTEAGLRASVKNRALPIIFDEAEGETPEARKRMQSILDLLKMATREGGATTKKSDTNGNVSSYKIRSMALLSSIGVNLDSQADRTRFVVLDLKKYDETSKNNEKFGKFEKFVSQTLTKEYCDGLRARTVSLIPTIRKNIKTLEAAIIEKIYKPRIAINFATLLAGCYSLKSDQPISEKSAQAWVDSIDWSEHLENTNTDDDEQSLTESILDSQIDVTTGQTGPKIRLNISKIIDTAVNKISPDEQNKAFGAKEAKRSLENFGIKVAHKQSGEMISINKNRNIAELLEKTKFFKNYMQILERIDGAEIKKSVRIGSIQRDAVVMPLDKFMGN